MTSTVLEIANAALGREGLQNSLSSIATPTTALAKQIAAIFNTVGKDLCRAQAWAELTKLHYVTLSNGQYAYPLPEDFLTVNADTLWNAKTSWKVGAPLSGQDWMSEKLGWISSYPYNQYRIYGSASTGTFTVTPQPSGTTAGQQIAFEYQSANWLRPATPWQPGTNYSASAYVYSNESITVNGELFPSQLVILQNMSGSATSSTTVPLRPLYSDGSINWDPVLYDAIHADTDVVLLDEELFALGIIWRYYRAVGKPWSDRKQEYDEAIKTVYASTKVGSALYMAGGTGIPLVSEYNIPDVIDL